MPLIYKEKKEVNLVPSLPELQLYFISGFLFHITCEYSGINLWYAIKYCSL
jgi:hypothetical protein